MPQVITSPVEFKELRRSVEGAVGLVPTMGALHIGHGELLEKCRTQNKVSVLSIFVNPTQFNDPNDLKKYPRTFDADLELAAKYGTDYIFAPSFEDIYTDNYSYKITENVLSHRFCGAHRPGHFDGVLTVVMRLFNIVEPTQAYFGEKDFQQLKLIQGMTQAFFMNVKIVPVATVREASGLALSSRNQRLNPEQKQLAASINQILKTAASAKEAHSQLESKGFRVDYVEDWDQRRLAAVFVGDVRLIDNVEI